VRQIFWNILAVTVVITLFNFVMAVQQRQYNVIEAHDSIELRDYQQVVVASVDVKGDRQTAATAAFRLLFRYISGHNQSATKIAMTAPVAQQQVDEKLWRVSFFMPADWTFEQVPRALDSRVKLEVVKQVNIAAIQFSGRSSQSNLDKHKIKLEKFLQQHNHVYQQNPIYAFYNAPYVPWFLRRNEIMFILGDD